MRITILWKYYDAYLRSFYTRHPESASQSHQQQLESLLDDCFNWPCSVARRLKENGHEIHFIIANAKPLQQAWAAEHGVAFPSHDWQFSLPLKQVEKQRPDVVWLGLPPQYYGEYISKLKQSCRCVLAWISYNYPADLDLSHVDCILTSAPNFVVKFRSAGKASELLMPAFEPHILDRLGSVERDIEVSFIGGLTRDHIRRAKTLDALYARTSIQVWGYGFGPGNITGVRSLLRRIQFMLFDDHEVANRYHGEAWGMEMYRVLERSKMSINVHLDIATGISANSRMFEATGMGALLLNERTPNLAKLFQPDKEVATYASTDELVEKVHYYLEHDAERSEIAAMGQQRTITHHNTVIRSQELLSIMEQFT